MKNNRKALNIIFYILLLLTVSVLVWGLFFREATERNGVSDGIEVIDLDTIDLEDSGVEVNFAEVILSNQKESRKLIVSTQTGTVKTELTDRLIEQLDFDFMKKTQTVSYAGEGYFVVDLDQLTEYDLVVDREKKTVTIKIDHAYLELIEIDPDNIIIDEVKEGLLARGDIKLTVADYSKIEKELRSRLEEKFDTVKNGQAADELALKMVQEVYEPIVKAIDHRYDVLVVFQ